MDTHTIVDPPAMGCCQYNEENTIIVKKEPPELGDCDPLPNNENDHLCKAEDIFVKEEKLESGSNITSREYNITNSTDNRYSDHHCIVEESAEALDSTPIKGVADNQSLMSDKVTRFPYYCTICSKDHSCIEELQAHLDTHDLVNICQCNTCGKKLLNKRTLASHMKLHMERLVSCEQCDKKFHHKKDLIRHSRVHTGVKPFKCNICSKNFHDKSTLNCHVRVHTGEKPFQCPACSKSFSQKVSLRSHYRLHTNEKPYNCGICQKKFHDASILKRHARAHTGEKPFQCEICLKYFYDKSTLNCHVRIHSGIKPFQCHICARNFTQRVSLRSHLRVHNEEKPYECDVCKKNFHDGPTLKRHSRVHTGEKPFQCFICFKSFTQKVNLRTHLKLHIEEERYQCDVCKKSFTEKPTLILHLRTHIPGVMFQNDDAKSARETSLKTASKNRPYQCEICKEHITDYSNFKWHAKMHMNERQLILNRNSSTNLVLKNPISNTADNEPRDFSREYFINESTLNTQFREYSSENLPHGNLMPDISSVPQSNLIPDISSLSQINFTSDVSQAKQSNLTPDCSSVQQSNVIHDISLVPQRAEKLIVENSLLDHGEDEAQYDDVSKENISDVTEKEADQHNVCEKYLIDNSDRDTDQSDTCQVNVIEKHVEETHKVDGLGKQCKNIDKVEGNYDTHEKNYTAKSKKENQKSDLFMIDFTEKIALPLHSDYECRSSTKVNLQITLKSPTQIYLCKVCNMRFPEHVQLVEHKNKHAPESFVKNEFTSEISSESTSTGNAPTGIEQQNLPKRKENYSDNLNLEGNHHTVQKTLLCDSPSIANAVVKQENCIEKSCKCVICADSFTDEFALSAHLKVHVDQTSSDDSAHAASTSRKQVATEVTSTAVDFCTQKKSHLCEICDKRFTKAGALTSHVMRAHNKDRFTCDVCGDGFKLKSDYKNHLNYHTGSKPFQCFICQKAFARLGSLENHLKRHDREMASGQKRDENAVANPIDLNLSHSIFG